MAVSFSDVVFAHVYGDGYENIGDLTHLSLGDLMQLCLEEMTEEQFERACLKYFFTCKSIDDIVKHIPKSYFEDCDV